MSQTTKTVAAVCLGAVLGGALVAGMLLNSGERDRTAGDSDPAQKKPLYWVAPMDADYRRDKPGKSPMGMDLVPVYPEDSGGITEGPGTIEISPEVVNNLGVRTARVERRALHTTIRTVGYVQYDEDRLIHIHPRVEGWIERLYVKAAGDPVAKGEPL